MVFLTFPMVWNSCILNIHVLCSINGSSLNASESVSREPARNECVLSGAEGLRLSRRLAGGRSTRGRVAEEVIDGRLASCLEKHRTTAGSALSGERSNRGEENLASPVHRTPNGAGL